MTEDITWPQVTKSDPELTFHQKLHGECCRRPKTRALGTCFSSYRAVTCSRCQSHDTKWRHMVQVTRSDSEATSFHWKWPGKVVGSRKLTFSVRFSSYRTVTHSRWHSCDRKRRRSRKLQEVTRKWRHSTRSGLQKAAGGRKLAFWVRFRS